MARGSNDDELIMDDELTAAFLGDDDYGTEVVEEEAIQTQGWSEEEQEPIPGQLALDVYETKEKLVVKARTAGVKRNDIDVSISDNVLSIKGAISAGNEDDVENYFLQECYWGEFYRSIVLPTQVKEDEVEANLKDGVLTISFIKVKQDTVKKIQIL